MIGTDQRHGTYAGAVQHQRDGESECEPCRRARNAYMRTLRRTKPEVRARERLMARARRRAVMQLINNHWPEFQRLFEEAIQLEEEEAES